MCWCEADSDLLLTAGKDQRLLLWNPNTAQLLAEVPNAARNWPFLVRVYNLFCYYFLLRLIGRLRTRITLVWRPSTVASQSIHSMEALAWQPHTRPTQAQAHWLVRSCRTPFLARTSVTMMHWRGKCRSCRSTQCHLWTIHNQYDCRM